MVDPYDLEIHAFTMDHATIRVRNNRPLRGIHPNDLLLDDPMFPRNETEATLSQMIQHVVTSGKIEPKDEIVLLTFRFHRGGYLYVWLLNTSGDPKAMTPTFIRREKQPVTKLTDLDKRVKAGAAYLYIQEQLAESKRTN